MMFNYLFSFISDLLDFLFLLTNYVFLYSDFVCKFTKTVLLITYSSYKFNRNVT